MCRQVVDAFPFPEIPDTDGVVVAAGGEAEPVRREVRAQQPPHVPLQVVHALART
eukprot:CAMPEP_0194692100 /NCGR_PEP_ID=MMETSP0295-20121207/19496_1 /TAXON_ID=39354 /ORGANISM="Heterosigma akashiwo, Strain CCMP2393" /LENGTH=54 /DNA_ID=CAMNT_0039582249 /DNA_START=351 /DNA_END=515 /DNA_ORIENTATION=-